MLSGRVQAEDSERKIERQQLVGGDKVETHTTAHAHPHQLFISWPEQIHIYRFPEQQTARRSAQKFWITCQASHQHLYRTSYIYDKEHQGQRNHSRMWNTLARLRAQSILLNTHSQAQTGALRSPELLLVLLLNPATDCQWKLIWSYSNDTALQKERWTWGGETSIRNRARVRLAKEKWGTVHECCWQDQLRPEWISMLISVGQWCSPTEM